MALLPFSVDLQATSALRERSFRLLDRCLELGQQRITLRVLESLFKLTEPPRQPSGGYLPDDDETSKAWWAERAIAFARIRSLVTDNRDPIVHLFVADKLKWYMDYRPDHETGQIARQILTSIPETVEFRTLALLTENFNTIPMSRDNAAARLWEDAGRRDRDAAARWGQMFLEESLDPRGAAVKLENGLIQLQAAGVRDHPNLLWPQLASGGSHYLAGLAAYCLQFPASLLSRYFGAILSELRRIDREYAATLAFQGLESKQLPIAASIVSWAGISSRDPTILDILVVRALVAHRKPHCSASCTSVSPRSWSGRCWSRDRNCPLSGHWHRS